MPLATDFSPQFYPKELSSAQRVLEKLDEDGEVGVWHSRLEGGEVV